MNTLVVAEAVGVAIGAEVRPLAAEVVRGPVRIDSAVIGIAYPVYCAGFATIVRRFAEQLRGIEGSYIFALPTYGGGFGVSARELDAALETGGGRLSATFGVHIPQNPFRKPWEREEALDRRFHHSRVGWCENCLACYEWCPERAIETKIAEEGFYFRNSRVSVGRIIAQRRPDTARRSPNRS